MDTTSSAALTIGIDIGGTKIAGGLVDPHGRVLRTVRHDTPAQTVVAVADTILRTVSELRASADQDRLGPVQAVGVGAAGWISADRSRVLFSPHLAWRDTPLRDDVAARLDLPVWVDNDANAAAWAEYRFGAARGHDVVACVTLGTGIGGGLIAGGRLWRGAHGVAGEWGHTRVVPDGRRCVCGHRGCWETYASGRALARVARELVEAAPAAGAALLAQVGGDPSRLTGEDVAAVAAAGDPSAMSVVREIGEWLGQGIVSIAMIADPSIVVVGGGVGALGEALLEPARERFLAALPGVGFRPALQIVSAALGPQAGLIGAADLARAR